MLSTTRFPLSYPASRSRCRLAGPWRPAADGEELCHNRCMPRRGAFAAGVVAGAVAFLASACGGSTSDKAGALLHAKPLTLTLAAHDDDYAYGTFAAAVDRLFGG